MFIDCIFICEELAQDMFLRLYEKRVVLEPASRKTINYLYVSARNRTIDYIRRKAIEKKKYNTIAIKEVTIKNEPMFFNNGLHVSQAGHNEIADMIHDTIVSGM